MHTLTAAMCVTRSSPFREPSACSANEHHRLALWPKEEGEMPGSGREAHQLTQRSAGWKVRLQDAGILGKWSMSEPESILSRARDSGSPPGRTDQLPSDLPFARHRGFGIAFGDQRRIGEGHYCCVACSCAPPRYTCTDLRRSGPEM